MNLITYLIIGIAWIWGVHCFFQEGFIGYNLGQLLVPKLAQKPLFDCPPCMSSVYGSLIFFLSPMVHEFSLLLWPVYCICLCGLNFIIKEMLYD